MIDIDAYYTKLANKELLPEGEIVSLLRELEHFRCSLAYLASCQAATLESLPKSSSKSARRRHVTLCETAADMLEGDRSRGKYATRLDTARERCLRAAETHRPE